MCHDRTGDARGDLLRARAVVVATVLLSRLLRRLGGPHGGRPGPPGAAAQCFTATPRTAGHAWGSRPTTGPPIRWLGSSTIPGSAAATGGPPADDGRPALGSFRGI